MTVVLSILLAAVVGGVVFALIDGSFQRRDRAARPAPPTEPLPSWQPEPPPAEPEPAPEPERRRDGLWAGWARD